MPFLSRRGLLAALPPTLALPALALPALALPGLALPGLARAEGAPAARFRFEGQRVLLPVTLDGQGPYDFVFDTGAVISGIRLDLARTLKLQEVRQVKLGFGGPGRRFPLYAARNVVIGGNIRQAEMAVFGLEGNLLGGQGLLASGMMTTLDADLAFSGMEYRLYPGGRGEREGFTRIGSQFRADENSDNGSPQIVVEAVLDGTPGRFILDTGMPRTIVLFGPAVRRRGLWDDARPHTFQALSGITGMSRGRIVRGQRLTLGPLTIDRPLVTLRDPELKGPLEVLDGIIGIDLIQQLDLSTEVAAGALWVRPSGRPAPAERYNRAGVWLGRRKDGRVFVDEVAPGSAAAAAGVQAGDLLDPGREIGESAAPFMGPAGAVVTLNLERGGQRRAVPVTLADLP